MRVRQLSKREKILLGILGASAALALLTMGLVFGLDRISTAQKRAAQYQEQIRRLSQSMPPETEVAALRDRLQTELAKRKARFYTPDQMNTYAFGTIIKKELTSRGIRVIRYQVVESKGKSSLEFAVSGSIRALIQFFKQVSESDKFWTISSLSLSMKDAYDSAEATFRVGYEVIETDNN